MTGLTIDEYAERTAVQKVDDLGSRLHEMDPYGWTSITVEIDWERRLYVSRSTIDANGVTARRTDGLTFDSAVDMLMDDLREFIEEEPSPIAELRANVTRKRSVTVE